ncbi:MAG TPA: hypothetical protein VIJ00_03060 [Nakamurella sp.]
MRSASPESTQSCSLKSPTCGCSRIRGGAVAILDDLVGDDPHPSIPPGSRDQPFAVNDRIVWFWNTLREAEAAALSFDPGILLGVVAGLVDSDVCQAARSTAAA